MSVLFDIGHPADFHMFNAVKNELGRRGFESHIMLRDKEVSFRLAEKTGVPFIRGTRQRKGFLVGIEFFEWMFKTFKEIKKNKIKLVVSSGNPQSSVASWLRGIPHIVFNDTETVKVGRFIYCLFAKKIYSSEAILKSYGPKHVFYKGLHELAYLDPRRFTPNPEVLEKLGIGKDEKYAIVRFVSWVATHDAGCNRMNKKEQEQLVGILKSSGYRVFISSENPDVPESFKCDTFNIPPHLFHDALAFSSLVVGDGASTASEAALLGVPCLYISDFADKLGYIKMLKERKLLEAEKDFATGTEVMKRLISESQDFAELRKKNLAALLKESVDVAVFMADRCEEFLKKAEAK